MAQKPSLALFSGTESFGDVFMEQNQMTLKYFEFNIPFSSTSGRVATNVLGKTRILMIQGATDGDGFTGLTTDAKLLNFIDIFEDWLNSNDGSGVSIQTSTVYTSSMGRNYTVDGVDFMWTRSFNDPSRILYTLIMKQA
ncbi:MAG: hypothetical protein ACOCUD_03690 [Bacillota bacterium]